ncbi:ribbon-helix-helix protein, CopG family [Actinacidiphila alni]|uniref:Ribbon-helix-helix protein, CopG family n=1 Tax=Actinacidiphila alni TaxID=380248 RepID=A0A1I2IMW1_9ACTN|nr:ribbon-helix-helix protein, CopG family [Actinacidiphila alni]SFF42958.1 hypothetical protein SAMN05216251_11419 [Actinacidiphila alni]
MASRVLSLRIDADLWDRIRDHAAKRGMSAQDYVVQALVRDDFDERFKTAVDETERFYGQDGPLNASAPARDPQSRPSAGIR